MKSLEIQTNKRILIVETESFWIQVSQIGPDSVKFICRGSDLTEEIVAGMVDKSIHTGLYAHYVKGIPVNTFCYKEALPSLISAIEAQGWYWGSKDSVFTVCPGADPFAVKLHEEKRESHTFHPERVIIFEIVEGQS